MDKRYVLVTGAAGGIGQATTDLLATQGFIIFAADNNSKVLNLYTSSEVIPVLMDITDINSINKATEIVKSHTSTLYGIVNIAGIFDQFPLAEVAPESFEKLIRANLLGPQFIVQSFFSFLVRGKGRVINLSSETVLAQMPLQSYGFSKKLFDVWNTQLRMELGLLDIYVSVVRPGGHLTPFINKSAEVINSINEESQYVNLLHEIKRVGGKELMKTKKSPLDVGKVISKALLARKPRKIYNVNVSMLFRMLSMLPDGFRERLMVMKLKRWM